MKKYITFFMWEFQHTFAWEIAYLGSNVFAELGLTLKPDVLLVGVRKPDVSDGHPVCVEPEDGKWSLALFADIPERYPEAIRTHPLQSMFYGDEPSMREKPENIRRISATLVVRESLKSFDQDNDVVSFCGSARAVGSYYVVPVIQLPASIFEQFPPLDLPDTGDEFQPKGKQSLIHSAIWTLLDEGSHNLVGPNPGQSLSRNMRSAAEIVSEAADRFMSIPELLTAVNRYGSRDLFQRLNIISSLFYERKEGLGSLVLARPDSSFLRYSVRFKKPVPMREPRWARKILEMASSDLALIASEGLIHGLGVIAPDHDPVALDAFTVNFLDHYQWELRHGDRPLMYSRYREPKLPQEPISHDRFVSNYLRLFSTATQADADNLWELFKVCLKLNHGSMIVVAEDAASEAKRLSDQGTSIEPVKLTPDLLERVSGIDGTVLIDPIGVCHAIGVILDGEATSECSPARGSRFNSALRYVRSERFPRLAIIASDDRTIDMVPLLKPQIRKRDIDSNIIQLEKASTDNYHAAQNWLDKHRFYLNASQCSRINRALKRLDELPKEVGEIRWIPTPFEPNDQIDDSYFL